MTRSRLCTRASGERRHIYIYPREGENSKRERERGGEMKHARNEASLLAALPPFVYVLGLTYNSVFAEKIGSQEWWYKLGVRARGFLICRAVGG